MYQKELLTVKQANVRNASELLEGIHSMPLENSLFLDSLPTMDVIEYILNDPLTYTFMTYYDGELMGYSMCNFRNTATVDFHWGICRKHKYITKMIEQSFYIIKKMPVNFLGFVPANNKLSEKITNKIGFERVGVIKGYYHDGTDANLYQYSKED